MRALALFVTLLATLPLGFVAPSVGVLVWCWLSFMNPNQLVYLPVAVPVVYASAIVTGIGWVISREPKRLPGNLAPWLILLFMFWTTLATFFALDPDSAWIEWNRNSKTFVLALAIMVVMTNRVRLHALAWVIVLSIAYFSLKGGLFTLLTGGGSHVQGIPGTVTGDNNNLGLIMVMSWPLIHYLRLHSANRLVRLGLLALMGLTIVAVLGTYSRGAFLGLAVVIGYFWWKAKQKITFGVIGAAVVVPALLFMPKQWVDRINTIQTYQSDGSAMGRITQWHFAIRLAEDRPLVGGGFDASQSRVAVAKFYPDEHVLAYHSIWFQALGDNGIPGLAIFIVIGMVGWRNASVTRRAARTRPELAWARDLATMCQVSLAGYFLAGTFLSLAYYDCYYAIIALLAVLRDVAKPVAVTARAEQPDTVAIPAPVSLRYAAERQMPTKSA